VTDLELLYFAILPIAVVLIGYIGARLHERSAPKDPPRPRIHTS
jgi:hypothetical protein